MTGIPIYNVNNNCSTGATALILAKQLIETGNDCVLAVGFEKMQRGSLSITVYTRKIFFPYQVLLKRVQLSTWIVQTPCNFTWRV